MSDILPLRAVSNALNYIDEELQKDGFDLGEVIYDVDTLTFTLKVRPYRCCCGIGRPNG